MLTAAMRVGAERPESNPVRKVLVLTDAVTILISWLVVSAIIAPDALARPDLRLVRLLGVVAVGVALIALDRLYRAEPANIRSLELVRLSRVAVGTAIAAYVFGLVARGHRKEALIGALCCFLALAFARWLYAAWLKGAWKRGKWLRPVVVIGSDAEAARVATLLDHHPEFGFQVCGLIADPVVRRAHTGRNVALLGPPTQALQIIREAGAKFAVISSSGLSPVLRKQLLRELTVAGIHVQVSTGLSGISPRRVRALPVGHEPFFYVEPLSLGRPQIAAKRTMDLIVTPFVLLFTLPLLVMAAVCIKLEDRGPILFRQVRVGRDGRRITVYKLRTMVVDAESRLAQIMEANERTGPALQARGGSPDNTRRADPASVEHRRAAPAVQRAERDHVAGRTTSGPSERGRPVRRGAARAAPCHPGSHRALAGGSARRPLLRVVPAARHALRGQLDVLSRPGDHGGHSGGASQSRDAPARSLHQAWGASRG